MLVDGDDVLSTLMGNETAGATNVVFVCSVEQVEWPMFGEDERALANLTTGYCPLCPTELINAAGASGAVCSCCGSTWRWSDEELNLLPGPRVSMR